MSEETAPDAGVPEPDDAPKSLMEQMEEMMAALNADLSRLDADLQSAVSEEPPPAS